MDTQEQAHFDQLYRLHLRTLTLRGMRDATIDSYARAVAGSPTTLIAHRII